MSAQRLPLIAIWAVSHLLPGCAARVEPPQPNENPVPSPIPALVEGPKTQQSTADELAAAKKIYGELGGYRGDFQPGNPSALYFSPSVPLSTEGLSRLPDPSFDYTLQLGIGSKTPAGAIRCLKRLRNLKSVIVYHDVLQEGGDTVRLIAELAEIPNLERLTLTTQDKFLSDELAEALVAFTSLRQLYGSGTISDKGLKSLARLPKLEHLALESCDVITDTGLAHLAGMPSLRSLVLEQCDRPTAAGLRPFTTVPRLVMLAVNGAGMKADALAEIEKIRTLEDLSIYSFDGAQITEHGLRQLARLPHLRTLYLPRMEHTDAGLKELAAASALESVGLYYCTNVTDAGVKELTRLTALKSLDIRGAAQMTDAGLNAIAGLPHLERFYLNDARRVTDKGLESFIDARVGRLTELGLSSLAVTDQFVACLPKKAPRLTSLHFYLCEAITDASVARLTEMAQLHELGVHGTSVSPAGTNTLKQKLPGCRILGSSVPAK